ncbi:MAG: DsbA family oxidoreductase [Pseudomonadota bacterium]
MQTPLRIDIVSDVMCPWCIIGYKQLEGAMAEEGLAASVHWHPFELNSQMGPDGQNLAEHVAEKYGSTADQSARTRNQMEALGDALGFSFRFGPESRIRNSFRAHRLLHWARDQDQMHSLKLALFAAHFTDQQNVDDPDVLAGIAAAIGLDADTARSVAATNAYADEVRAHEHFWTSRGVHGVPAMVFESRYLVTGAQGVGGYKSILQKVIANSAA